MRGALALALSLALVACRDRPDEVERARLRAEVAHLEAQVASLRAELAKRAAAVTPTGEPMLERLPEPPADLGQCVAYVASIRRFLDCPAAVPGDREEILRGLDEFAKTWVDFDPELRPTLDSVCRQANDRLLADAAAKGCK